jgi:hypothetical protein
MLLGSGSRWGFVIGLATQPFWFYTSFRHRQWGIFIASIFYAFAWAMGVYRNFWGRIVRRDPRSPARQAASFSRSSARSAHMQPDHLYLVQPRRFYRVQQRRHGRGHVLAPRSRFLPDEILRLFIRVDGSGLSPTADPCPPAPLPG